MPAGPPFSILQLYQIGPLERVASKVASAEKERDGGGTLAFSCFDL